MGVRNHRLNFNSVMLTLFSVGINENIECPCVHSGIIPRGAELDARDRLGKTIGPVLA
jgi:hypothetical protein